MVSEYVVDIFKYLKQTEVRVLERSVLLPKLILHPQLTTPQSVIHGVAKGAGLVHARNSVRLAVSSTRPIQTAARDALSLREHHRSILVCTGHLPCKTATRRYYVLFISSKVKEVAPSVSHFFHCADSSYTEFEIWLAERHVLKMID